MPSPQRSKQQLVFTTGSPAHFDIRQKPDRIWTLLSAQDPAAPPRKPITRRCMMCAVSESHPRDWTMQDVPGTDHQRLLYYSPTLGTKQGAWLLLEWD